MKNIFLFILLTFSATVAFGQKKSSSDRFSGLDAELNALLKDWHAAGFAVAVVEKDKIVYSKGFGYRDYENKTPVTPNTNFAIGSSSKAFTSGLLGILKEEGKLTFEDSPIKHIPELRFKNAEMNELITIRDIMTHRTGLPRHDISWYLFSTNSRDSLMQRIAYQEPFAKVRERWYYNNFMFLAQGVIAEHITGKSWEENIDLHFFQPLEMKTSSTDIDGLKNGKEASFGYQVKNDSAIKKMDYYDIAAMGPAGSINSNVTEMSNWVMTWINGGKFKDKQILPESYVKEAMSSQMVMSGGVPDKEFPDLHMSSYGYGWMMSSYKGHYRVEHGGNIDGFSANVSFFPSDSIGIIVLANQNGSVIPSLARNIISDRVLKETRTDWNKTYKERSDKAKAAEKEALATKTSSQKTGTKPSHLLVEYTGDYSNPGYGTLDIYFKNDSLFAKAGKNNMWLKHYHYNIFSPYPVVEGKVDTVGGFGLQFNFRTNDSGEISSFVSKLEPAIDPLEFKRTPKGVIMDKAELEKYVGDYELPGIVAKIYIKGENTLYLLVPGQPEYELLPLEKHKFALKILDGFKLEFVEGESGNIAEVLFVQPNGTFKAKRK
ncbi:serine hydrolase [Aquiflexum gelatinilyticum]|uniref:Serine hydrolase n=1 Tax=Aquiflexum gelatinilyticum TaxID=2961943 RepID=A0A9X2P478_9BACT|nr:serine hydrolase [Aquiflexum gelatinilyticum]MCR9014416.1 serine hydrolase [Aquiflexum gelatinilyticum]